MPTCLKQPTTKTQPADRIPLDSSLTASCLDSHALLELCVEFLAQLSEYPVPGSYYSILREKKKKAMPF